MRPRPSATSPPQLRQWMFEIVPLADAPPSEMVGGAASPQLMAMKPLVLLFLHYKVIVDLMKRKQLELDLL